MLKIRKNDIVKVIAGRELGKVGRVIRVDQEREKVFVEKVNLVKRHSKPGKINPQGGIIEKEAPLACSNVMIMCDKCNKPTRVAVTVMVNSEGKNTRTRTCKKCGDALVSKKK